MGSEFQLRAVVTGETYAADAVRYRADDGGLLEVALDQSSLGAGEMRRVLQDRLAHRGGVTASGVWRYREFLPPIPDDCVVSRREGNTPTYESDRLAAFTGVDGVRVKHEGCNPTGSFKDRGMTCGVSAAKWLGQTSVACASTGNTSASMASYAAVAGMKAFVFIPAGGVAAGKLAQAVLHGASVVQIEGNFDDAMRLVQEVCAEFGVYLLNSINPFRIEGQKAIGMEIAQDCCWQMPDWIVLPGGNLGNTSAIYKGLRELKAVGVIDRLPRMAVIQAAGAAPLHAGYIDGFAGEPRTVHGPDTIASAIRIGAPASWVKCVDAVRSTEGLVESVTDDEIIAAKRAVDTAGIGAEAASCASVAGLRRLASAGVVKRGDSVVCVLTGHILKDAEAAVGNYGIGESLADGAGVSFDPIVCQPTLESVRDGIARELGGG